MTYYLHERRRQIRSDVTRKVLALIWSS